MADEPNQETPRKHPEHGSRHSSEEGQTHHPEDCVDVFPFEPDAEAYDQTDDKAQWKTQRINERPPSGPGKTRTQNKPLTYSERDAEWKQPITVATSHWSHNVHPCDIKILDTAAFPHLRTNLR